MDENPLLSAQIDMLVVHGNSRVGQIVSSILAGKGYNVDSVARGTTGIYRAQAKIWSMVWIEAKLPDIEGLDVACVMSALPLLVSTPIILLAESGTTFSKEQLIRSNIWRVVWFPFRLSHLNEILLWHERSQQK